MHLTFRGFRGIRTSFSPRNIRKSYRSMYARVPQAIAQFVLKLENLSHLMEPAPIVESARAYGLHSRIWLLLHLNYHGQCSKEWLYKCLANWLLVLAFNDEFLLWCLFVPFCVALFCFCLFVRFFFFCKPRWGLQSRDNNFLRFQLIQAWPLMAQPKFKTWIVFMAWPSINRTEFFFSLVCYTSLRR